MDLMLFNEVADKITKKITSATNLNLSQIRLLLYFQSSSNEAQTMGDLAASLNISISTLSRQIKQKVTNSLLNIDTSAKDSTKKVQLNDQGLIKLQQLKLILKQVNEDLFSYWDEEELSFFQAELNLIKKRLN